MQPINSRVAQHTESVPFRTHNQPRPDTCHTALLSLHKRQGLPSLSKHANCLKQFLACDRPVPASISTAHFLIPAALGYETLPYQASSIFCLKSLTEPPVKWSPSVLSKQAQTKRPYRAKYSNPDQSSTNLDNSTEALENQQFALLNGEMVM